MTTCTMNISQSANVANKGGLMPTQTELEFYKAFGIKPLPQDCEKCGAKRFALGQCAEVVCKRKYPEITDTQLLLLIKMFVDAEESIQIDFSENQYGASGLDGGYYQDTFAEAILSCCIEAKRRHYHAVRKIMGVE